MSKLQAQIEAIQLADTKEEAFALFNAAMGEYGYDNNVYTLMTDYSSIGEKAYHGLATTYPKDWLDYYNANNYQRVDAVWERLLNRPTPFFWNDVVQQVQRDPSLSPDRVKRSLKVMNEAADAGVADGIGISYLNPLGEIAGIGLSRNRREKSQSYEELAQIYLISTLFHERFLSFYEKNTIPKLSPREREVLLWATENKSDPDIATILNVTLPTIRFHWKNIFRKLGVNGRWLAIIKAIRFQIITPQLIRLPYQTR